MCTLKRKNIFAHNHNRNHTPCYILICFSLLAFCNCSTYIANLYFITDRTCSLHNVKLETKLCHIRYGLYRPVGYLYTSNGYQKKVRYDSSFCEGYTNEFPEAYRDNYVLGGCVVYPQKFMRIQYCPVCNANNKRWLNENQNLKPFPSYDIRNQILGCRSHSPSKQNYDSLFFSPQPFGKYSKDLVYRGLNPDLVYVKKNYSLNTVDSVIINHESATIFHRNTNTNNNKTIKIHGRLFLFIVNNLLQNARRGTYHDPEAPEEYIIEISTRGKYVGCNDCLGLIGHEKRQIRNVDWLMRRLIKKYLAD